MITIAVASEGSVVTEHFGHCENFNIYKAENGVIKTSESIRNPGHKPGQNPGHKLGQKPGHKPGFLPNYLNDRGVNVIISGGMGGGAVDIFNEKGIEVITGASGEAIKTARDYLAGRLQSTGSVCHSHEHRGECGE